MPDIELFVEGKPVDINEAFSTLLTLAIDNIKDFGAKNTSFSKEIILPGTKRNNALFGNIFDKNASNYYTPTVSNIGANFNPAIGARAMIFSKNMQIFKGIIRILRVIDDNGQYEYEAAVFGELGGLVAKLGNKLIEDLDFSAYDHVYNLTNIVNSWSNTPGSGYYYPLMDYGNYSVGKHDWEVRTFRPALYVKEYIDKMFADAQYTYQSTLFNTSRFKGLIVPQNKKELSMKGDRVAYGTAIATNYLLYTPSWGNPTSFAFDNFSGTNWSLISGNNFTYTAATPQAVKMKLRLTGIYHYDVLSPFESNGIRLAINHWTSVSTSGTELAGVDIPGGSLDIPFDITLEVNPYTMNQNDFLQIVGISSVVDGASIDITGVDFTVQTLTQGWVNVNIGDTLLINDSIPKNYLQKDFLSSILKLFNCYVFDDYDNEQNVYIQPFVDFYLNAGAVDWSNKVDRSKPMKYKPMGELNARYYAFKFKSDSDYFNDLYQKRYNKEYGSFIYDSQYEFVNESKDVELIFSGTPLVGYAGEEKVYSTIMKVTGSSTTPVEERVDSNIRILQTKLVTGVTSWAIKNGGGTIGTYTEYPYAGHLDDPDVPTNDIQFGVPEELFFTLLTGGLNVNQFNVYWSSYMAEITDKDSKILNCMLHLSNKDIYRLNFATLIYIDGSLWRINSIKDFNATNEDICEGEFLKVINRLY